MEKILRFSGIDCANCAAKLEKKLGKIKNVDSLTLSFLASKILVVAKDEHMEEVINEIYEVCKKNEPEMSFR